MPGNEPRMEEIPCGSLARAIAGDDTRSDGAHCGDGFENGDRDTNEKVIRLFHEALQNDLDRVGVERWPNSSMI